MTTVEPARSSSAPSADLLPFGWDEYLDDPVFRFPAPDDPAPGAARLLAMSLYAALLGLAGAAAGLYAVIAVLGGAPGWYLPALGGLTLLGVAPAVAAFLAIHQRVVPWLLMAVAAIPMAGAVALAVSY